MSGGRDAALHRLHSCRERGSEQYVPKVRDRLADLQRSVGLCRADFEWQSGTISKGRDRENRERANHKK